MSSLHERRDIGPTCPSGGNWFSCGYGSFFVGCCTNNDACEQGIGCPVPDLRVASFTNYTDIPDQLCPSGSAWYTCQDFIIPFMGCCAEDACQDQGCAQGFLRAATLNTTNDAAFSPTSSISTSTATSTISFLSPTTSSISAASSTPISSTSSTSSTSTNTGAIAGGVVGGVVAIIALLALLLYHRRRTRSQHTKADEVQQVQKDESRPFLPENVTPVTNPQRESLLKGPLQNPISPYIAYSKSSPLMPRPVSTFSVPGSPPPPGYTSAELEDTPRKLPRPISELPGVGPNHSAHHSWGGLSELDGEERVGGIAELESPGAGERAGPSNLHAIDAADTRT